jgi:outer membrane autotransporter protein
VDGLVTNAAATGYVQSRTGTLGLNAYSAGGYWTHYGPSGWYLDAVLQGTYYNGNAMTQFASLPINGSGFISSLEAGYPIPLPLGPLFVLEPEAQIIWQQVSFNQANDGLGPVALGTTSGATGRLGLRGARGPSSARMDRCGSPMRAQISGGIGVPRQRRCLGSSGTADRRGDAAGVRRRRDRQARPGC